MSVKLTYTKINGEVEEVAFEKSVKEITLNRKEITGIDISPLRSCKNLESIDLGSNKLQSIELVPLKACVNLNLGYNHLHSIDLTPLSSSDKLETLYLKGNEIQYIDLAPLSTCPNLEKIFLNKNRLQNIDLTPLSSCSNFNYIGLGENDIQDIDLSPLSLCEDFRVLDLSENQLQSVNLAPLSVCENLKNVDLRSNQIELTDVTPLFREGGVVGSFVNRGPSSWVQLLPDSYEGSTIYMPPTHQYPWSFLYKVTDRFPNDFRVQHDVLKAFGFGDYGFIDRDLTDELLSISLNTPVENAQTTLVAVVMDEITRSVDKGGQTTGLHLENLASKHGEFAVKVQEITELRAQEIDQTRIRVDGNLVDLRSLWLTAYGHEILSALGLRLLTNSINLEQVKKPFIDMGYELNLGESLKYGVRMSDDLKDCIWWIAKNRGKTWRTIPSYLV